MNMKAVRQLLVLASNKPGTLSRISEMLAAGWVNIIALNIEESPNQGIIRLVVDKPDNAIKILSPEYEIKETGVLQVEVPNKPGSLAEVAAKLSAANINIEYIYASAGESVGQAIVIIKTVNIKRAMSVLDKGV